MVVNSVAVMRRRSDSWLNATQILKVAGMEKGKRTKVLEKEILAGEHEKVQGGYGRYQGTWINYKRGREFCRQYGVEELLLPLLEYDMGQDGAQPGNGGMETPTKEQAMAAQRKKMMYNGTENRSGIQTPNGTFFKNISATAVNAVNAINKARFDSPGPRPGSGNKRPANVRKSSMQQGSQESQFAGSSQQSIQSFHSDGSHGINGQLDPAFGNYSTPYFTKPKRPHSSMDQESPRKKARPSSSMGPFSQSTNGDYDRSIRDTTPTEPNESFVYHQLLQPDLDSNVTGLQPLPRPMSTPAKEKQHLLASLFLDPIRDDLSNLPSLDGLSGDDLDIPIDHSAHTALHWAATLAKPSLIRALIAKGANIFRVNIGGETALMRAVASTNNHELGSFPELLELLGPTIEVRDGRGRSLLHHVAVASAIKGRSAACRYYLDSLLEFVVRQGSASNSQQNSFNSDPTPQSKRRPIGLARFMSEIVNAQDMSGDTALNLAARTNNKSIIQQLLEVGANPSIPNRGGLRPLDFDVGVDTGIVDFQPSSQNSLSSSQRTVTENRVSDTSKELLSCKYHVVCSCESAFANIPAAISTLITDTETSFRSELQAKQSLIDQAQTKLRETTTALTNERRNLAELERKATERQTFKQQMANLSRSNKSKVTFLSRDPSRPLRDDVNLGDADAGLAIDASQLRSHSLDHLDQLSPQTWSKEQEACLEELLPSHVLEARLRAYGSQIKALEEETGELRGKSSALERKLRRIVVLSTGLEEAGVDTMLVKLVSAVDSDVGEEVDTGRVREFLRRVEAGEV